MNPTPNQSNDIKKTCLSIDCPERTGGECNAPVFHSNVFPPSNVDDKLPLYRAVNASEELTTIHRTLDLSNLSTFAKEGILRSAIQYAEAHKLQWELEARIDELSKVRMQQQAYHLHSGTDSYYSKQTIMAVLISKIDDRIKQLEEKQ